MYIFLSRLGVSELILVDNDTVSASNINRQVLFSVSDVGQSKVEVARRTLDAHNIRTSQFSIFIIKILIYINCSILQP